MGSLAAILFDAPAASAILNGGGGAFGFATGALTLTNKDNENDKFVSLLRFLMCINSAVY